MLSNTLFVESKIEKANDKVKLDKVRGGGVELELRNSCEDFVSKTTSHVPLIPEL